MHTPGMNIMKNSMKGQKVRNLYVLTSLGSADEFGKIINELWKNKSASNWL